MTRPSSALIRRIAQEEANRAGITLAEILGPQSKPIFLTARTAAWKRIIAETECSARELAKVWGCNHACVSRALLPPKPPAAKPLVDAATARRLAWRYGAERAEEIVAGRDERTNRDIARWNALGQPMGVAR